MKRALITGITGQDGSYLAELLLTKGYEVFGLTRNAHHFERLTHLKGRVELLTGDLLSNSSVFSVIETVKPDEVYNLAAPGFVGASWDFPIETAESAAVGVVRLLEALRKLTPKARFYQASSSEMFGIATESPQDEKTPFHPRSPYGVSKVFAHWMAVSYREQKGMHATSGILFNHESPRRGLDFVPRKITHHAALIKCGLAKELRLGNLDAKRDWGFAGDYVEAMWLMLQQEKGDDYVIATGHLHSVRELVELAFSKLDLDYREFVKVDEKYYRPLETVSLHGNPSKARKALGWEPKTDFKTLVSMMVEADLALVRGNGFR